MAANQQDVRVRLTAEGMAEVIQAFASVSAAAKKSGKESESAFVGLNKQFSELGKNLLGGLGIVVAANALKNLFSGLLQNSEALTRLSAQTGISTGAIQAFGRAARETGVGADVANAGLTKFTVALGKAQIGSKLSAGALLDLGITAKELANLTPDQKLELVAQRLASIADPARRARDEMALFGRGGIELDQALVKLGSEGMTPFINKLKELGVFLDASTIASMKHTAESLKDLNDEAKGLATQFLFGLVPALGKTADELLRVTSGSGGGGFAELGRAAGFVIAYITAGFETLGVMIGGFAAKVSTNVAGVWAAVKSAASGNFKQALEDLRETDGKILQINAETAADIKRIWTAANAAPTTPGAAPAAAAGGGPAPASSDAQLAALAKARYNLLVTMLNNEEKLMSAHAKLANDILANQYKAGLISLTDYYAARAAIIDTEFARRIAIAQEKAAAEAKQPTSETDGGVQALQKQQRQAALAGEIADLQAQRQTELQANANELAQQQRSNDTASIAAQIKLLELEGKKAEASRLKLQLDTQALDLELRQGGVADAPRAAAVGQAQQQGGAAIDFAEQQKAAAASLSQLASAQKAVDDEVKAGQIFSIAGEQQIQALDRQRLPLLQQEADELLVIAKASGDPTMIAQAEAFNEKVQAIALSVNQVGLAMANLRNAAQSAIGAGLNTFLNDATKHTKTLKQDFSDAALSIVTDLEKIAEKALETAILKEIFGAAGGASGGSSGIVGSIVGALVGGAAASAASGGKIVGPGTSTSDSVPIMSSSGEFVVRAKAVAQPGVESLLTAINGGNIRGTGPPTGVSHYAAGGVVAASGSKSTKIVNVLDPSTLGDHLATRAGEDAVLNIIARNPAKVRQATS
jgi:hypothetical protein